MTSVCENVADNARQTEAANNRRNTIPTKPGHFSLVAEPFTINQNKLKQRVTFKCVDVMHEEFFKVIEGFLLASRRKS